MIKKGGRRDIFLGTRECQGYAETCVFGEEKGVYDEAGELAYGVMFHGFEYPDESGTNKLIGRFWKPVMKNGNVEFLPPEKCLTRKEIREMSPKPPNSSGLQEEGLLNELDTKTV